MQTALLCAATAVGAASDAGAVGGARAARPCQQPHLRSVVPNLSSLQPRPAAAAVLPAGAAAVPVQPQARLHCHSTSASVHEVPGSVVHVQHRSSELPEVAVSLSPGKKWRRLGRERTAGGVVKLAIAGTLPMLVVQVVLAWFSKIYQSHGELEIDCAGSQGCTVHGCDYRIAVLWLRSCCRLRVCAKPWLDIMCHQVQSGNNATAACPDTSLACIMRATLSNVPMALQGASLGHTSYPGLCWAAMLWRTAWSAGASDNVTFHPA
jgi:hypothetical protein